jgi:hypothetical protein
VFTRLVPSGFSIWALTRIRAVSSAFGPLQPQIATIFAAGHADGNHLGHAAPALGGPLAGLVTGHLEPRRLGVFSQCPEAFVLLLPYLAIARRVSADPDAVCGC